MRSSNRSAWQRIVASPLSMVGFAILLGVLMKAGWNIYDKAHISSERLTQTQAELAKLQARQSELSARVGYLSTPEGIDREIRTKYHAIKEGESVAVIVDEQVAGAAQASASQATSTVGWWSRLLRSLGF